MRFGRAPDARRTTVVRADGHAPFAAFAANGA